ncbi:hypothetical protein ZWY2020_038297 [Hordeum vulgare]|nr:hypothetical protein ZWY2020_038297 [Hordeum vulgare]
MLPRRYPLPALLRLFSTTCRRRSRLPPQPHPPNTDTLPPLPAAKKIPFTVSAHGRSWSDPYHWMRDTSDPDLAALLAAENAYAEAFVGAAGGGGLRARLAAEMRARLPPSAVSPPQPWGPWSYYQYVPNGMEYPVLSRKLRPSGGLAGRFLSYLSDWEKEEVLVFCKKMQSDEPGLLVFMEDDVNCCVDITSTKDFKYITVYVMESGNVREGLWPVQKRTNKVQYFLEHHNGFFYILTNAPLKDTGTTVEGYYLARCRAEKSLMDKWQVVALPGSDCTFQDMDIFHEHLVLFLQKDGLPLFCSIDLPVQIDFQVCYLTHVILCSILPGPNNDFMSSTFRMVVSSPVIPDLTVDYDMRKKTFTIVDQEEVTGLCSSLYTVGQSNVSSIQQNLQFIEDSQSWSDLSKLLSCERVQVVSHDGVSIPLVILYSREAHIHGESPGILSDMELMEDLDNSWCSDRLSLLARGWVLAFADVRGGGDPSWHLAGTKTNKINSIQDFAACGMHLIKEGLVHESRLCAMGCSAGGLLVGAVVNMLPNLFSAAVLKVPFLDICNTMLDPTLPLTILDYEEFGDPNIPVEFDAIRRYSPYDNLSPGKCYPSILVTASFNDTRVGVWEAAKWVSKVRDVTCPSCSNSVVLKTNMQSGHFGEVGA